MDLGELVKLNPSVLVELYILDVSDLPGSLPSEPADKMYRFYNYSENELEDVIVWQGKTYIPFPIEVDGFSAEGDKQTPRPTLSVSNLDSIIRSLVKEYDDLLGARVIRKRTFARYLDAVNFCGDNPYADPTWELPETVFYINKKISESIDTVSFELTSPWDVDSLLLPRRIMTVDTCAWKYKDTPCSYSGTKYWDYTNTSTTDPTKDVCAKRLTSCKLRFPTGVMPFGAFPALRNV